MSDLKKLKFVFISHESSLSGAPVLLLNLLKLLKENGYRFSIILKRGGKLEDKFSETGKTFIVKPENYQNSKFFLLKVLDYFFYRIRLLSIISEIKKADIIFSNTVTNGRFLKQVAFLKKPVLTYVHELESVIQYYNKKGDSNLSFSLSSAFCSPNILVTNNLLKHSLTGVSIFPLNYYFPGIDVEQLAKKQQRQKDFFDRYNLPSGKFYVAGMGAASLRKGIDLFIEAASIVARSDSNIHFIWLGDFIDDEEKNQINNKMRELGTFSFTLTGFIPHDAYNLLPFDILALTSREDPYPLVVLEAALLKIPAIVFKGSGGMEDFIKMDAGFLVETMSAQSLAEKVLYLKKNKEEITEKGISAFRKVKELHSNPSLIFEQLDRAITYLIKH